MYICIKSIKSAFLSQVLFSVWDRVKNVKKTIEIVYVKMENCHTQTHTRSHKNYDYAIKSTKIPTVDMIRKASDQVAHMCISREILIFDVKGKLTDWS